MKSLASAATADLLGVVLAIGVDLVSLSGRRRREKDVQQLLPREDRVPSCRADLPWIRRGKLCRGAEIHHRLQHPVQGPSCVMR